MTERQSANRYFDTLSGCVWPATEAIATGYISRVVGLTLEAKGINVALGARCLIRDNDRRFEAEAVGFDGAKTFLMPLRALDGISPGASVSPIQVGLTLPAGDQMLGRVIDGVGLPLDGQGPLLASSVTDLHPKSINPLKRAPIHEPLDVGVRSINAALTIGCGQRMGLFAGSGVGKSVLLGMITCFTEADVVIVALVGERGREVREFVENNLGERGLAKSVVVASPADDTPVMRLRAGMYASRLSEYFRDRGKKTLLLFDSLTRYAQAQREIALATGEPPATRGYPPSVFALLPKLVERAGNGSGDGGSVTAIYTVLTEDEDINDPVADAARAILDGHVVLSRALAGEGIYPAVDLVASISRSMNRIVSDQQFQFANRLKQWVARYQESKDLINVGAYSAGIDPETDLAIEKQPAITAFLGQSITESVGYNESVNALSALVEVAQSEDSSKRQTTSADNASSDKPDSVQANIAALAADSATTLQ